MLNNLSGPVRTVLLIVIGAPLIISFAAFGVPEMRQLTRNDAIRVGAQGFSALDVRKEFDRYVTNRRNQSDGAYTREQALAEGAQAQIVDSLSTQSALDQEAMKMGLIITRPMVSEYLQTSDQFKSPGTGKFDNETLDLILRQFGFSIREFEERIRLEMLRTQLLGGIARGGPASPAMINGLVAREVETRDVSYVTVSDDAAGTAPAATPAIIKDYYDKNQSQFMAPEYRTFTAVILKNDDYADRAEATDDKLREIYEANKARYETPERRTFYQITITEEADASAAIKALNEGRPFESVAIENGQNLAQVTRTDVLKSDIVDPAVANAVFAADAAAGAILGPIKGVFGFNVMQVAAVTPAAVKSFDEVRGEIETTFLEQGTKKRLFEKVEEIENERDTGAPIGEAAAKHGVAAQTIGPVDSFSFGKGGEIIDGVPGEVLQTAFKLEEGEEGEAIELADKSGYYFVSVTEVTPPAPMELERISAEVEARWRTAEREARIGAVVAKINDAVAKGTPLAQAAASVNRAPLPASLSRRSVNETFSQDLLDQIFSAAKGKAVSGRAGDGAQVIAVVDDIKFGAAPVGPEQITAFGRFVGNQLDQELIDAYAKAVRDDYKVKVNDAQIEAQFAETQ
ncbi:MAG: peptidyl-prolyl cis-trans isomerase [Parvularculaceae bacterium]|nr:peptidyl-prolyl cis-trans isomerase [Parvularculaceae bacterium]